MKKVLFFLLFITCFWGCTSTYMVSYRDPAYSKTNFKNLLITANTNRINYRLEAEDELADAFAGKGVSVFKSYQLFPPTRTFTDSAKQAVMAQNNIDACLVFYYDANKEEIIIPAGSNKTETAHTGGYTVREERHADFETNLYEIAGGNKIWMAAPVDNSITVSYYDSEFREYCGQVADKLVGDSLIYVQPDSKVKIIDRIKEDILNSRQSNVTITLKSGEVLKGKISKMPGTYEYKIFKLTTDNGVEKIIKLSEINRYE